MIVEGSALCSLVALPYFLFTWNPPGAVLSALIAFLGAKASDTDNELHKATYLLNKHIEKIAFLTHKYNTLNKTYESLNKTHKSAIATLKKETKGLGDANTRYLKQIELQKAANETQQAANRDLQNLVSFFQKNLHLSNQKQKDFFTTFGQKMTSLEKSFETKLKKLDNLIAQLSKKSPSKGVKRLQKEGVQKLAKLSAKRR